MYLNNIYITTKPLLKQYFLPFRDVWSNVDSGLYQEFLNEFCLPDSLRNEVLSVVKQIFYGAARTERTNSEAFQSFVNDNKAIIGELVNSVNNSDNSEQKDIIYLCVLMHIHADQKHMTEETAHFIRGLLARKEAKVPVNAPNANGLSAQKLCVIKDKAYHLDSAGRIVTLKTSKPLPLAEDLTGIVSFAYTDKLGLIAADNIGKIYLKNAPSSIELPQGTKIVSVAAYLSNYILLSSEGIAYTNAKLKEAAEWTNLRYIYVGLNSVCGIKNGSGTIISGGCGAKLSGYTDAARVCTHRDEQCRFIVLHKNGMAETDTGDRFDDVTSIAISDDGYYYATQNKIYNHAFGGGQSIVCFEASKSVNEMVVSRGNVFCE